MSTEELFNYWVKTSWAWGSGTDLLRARRAWVLARASLQELVAGLVRSRANDNHLNEAAGFLVEAGSFFEEHPELEIVSDTVAPDEGTGEYTRSVTAELTEERPTGRPPGKGMKAGGGPDEGFHRPAGLKIMSTTTPPDPTLIAAEIFIRCAVNVMNARSKPWALKPKEAEAIAIAALDAAEVFCEAAARNPEAAPAAADATA